MSHSKTAGSTKSSPLSWSSFSPRGEIVEVHSDNLQVEMARGSCHFSWCPTIAKEVSYTDEDLFLVIRDPESERNVAEYRVTHLVSKLVELAPDADYEALLVRKEKASFSCSTTSEELPQVALVTEEEGRQQLTWSGISWDRLRREVEQAHGVEWELDIDVALRISRWFAEGVLPEEEVVFPGLSDSLVLLGHPRQVDMEIVSRDDGRRLKRVFSVHFNARKNLEIVEKLAFHSPPSPPRLHLLREIVEPESYQLRVRWDVDHEDWSEVEDKILGPARMKWSEVEVVLRLFDVTSKKTEVRPLEQRIVTTSESWVIPDVDPGRTYQAELYVSSRDTLRPVGDALLVSPTLSIPARTNSLTIVPVDESRIYAFWSLDREQMKELGEDPDWSGQIVLHVFREESGELIPEPDLDVDFHWEETADWYVSVNPDHVYQMRLITVNGQGELKSLTPLSNSAQTKRLTRGTNAASFRSLNVTLEHPTVRLLDHPADISNRSRGRLVFYLQGHAPYWPAAGTGLRGNQSARDARSPFRNQQYEAVIESILPLVDTLHTLGDDGVDFRLAMLLSPPFVAFLRDPLHQEALLHKVDQSIARARMEVTRTGRHEPHLREAMACQLDRLLRSRDVLLRSRLDLTRPLRELQDLGRLEIVTCPASHALLPHLARYPELLRTQLHGAVRDYERVFGRRPNGLSLPEGGYAPGLEQVIQDAGFIYFFGPVGAVECADGPLAQDSGTPAFVKGSDVLFFPINQEESLSLNPGQGYPADGSYLEYQRIGRPLRSYRVTSTSSGHKENYDPDPARDRAAEHASHFLERWSFHFQQRYECGWAKPVAVVAAPTTLFGHRWYEGIDFLDVLLRKLHFDQDVTELSTPSDYVHDHHSFQEIYPNVSSTGRNESFESWSSGSVSWMLRHIQHASDEMVRMANEASLHDDRTPLENRILAQAARELLLAQSSDLPTAISSGEFSERMKERFFELLGCFWSLSSMYWGLSDGRSADEALLARIERRDSLLSGLDPLLCASVQD